MSFFLHKSHLGIICFLFLQQCRTVFLLPAGIKEAPGEPRNAGEAPEVDQQPWITARNYFLPHGNFSLEPNLDEIGITLVEKK